MSECSMLSDARCSMLSDVILKSYMWAENLNCFFNNLKLLGKPVSILTCGSCPCIGGKWNTKQNNLNSDKLYVKNENAILFFSGY